MLNPVVLAAFAIVLWAVIAGAAAAGAFRLSIGLGKKPATIVACVVFAVIMVGPGLHSGLQQVADIGVGLPDTH